MDRSRKRKADPVVENASDTPSKRQKIPEQTQELVSELGLKLVESLKNAKDKSGRNITELFLELPRKRELPDYYEIIKLPIAISTVERKLRNNSYTTLTEVESDFKRMVANAKEYNDETSEVYDDAERIRKLLQNFMKTNNPAHKDPNYVPFPTPIPGETRRKSANGASDAGDYEEEEEDEEDEEDEEEDEEEETKPRRPTITLSRGRRGSEHQVKASVEAKEDNGPQVNEFEGKSFGQVQIQIMEEFIQWKDEDDFAEFQPFVNLPPRTLTDYYQLIRRPMCLKMVIKRARGQHGREAATGVTDYKTWDAFENDVALIWKNAQEYNEDGSDMYELSKKFKDDFLTRLAEVKAKVEEPQSARIKLNARPKPVLHLGGKATATDTASPAMSIDTDSLERQRQSVNASVNAQTPSQATPDPRAASIPPLIKTEGTVAETAPDGLESKGSPVRVPSASPLPVSTTTPYVPAMATAPPTFAETYARTRPLSDALLPNIQIRTHPQLTSAKPLSISVAASPAYTNHSVTLMLPQTQYHLQILPTVSAPLAQGHRQYKLFVTVNGTRISPSTRLGGDPADKRIAYDVPLVPGVNRVEVEVVAVAKGGGTNLEGEKMVVLANLMRY